MVSSSSSSQWSRLLVNLGAWQGSFTNLSSEGKIIKDTPSLVALQGLNDNQTVRQTIQFLSSETGRIIEEKVLEYSSLNRSVLFFENGAFSQGSIQFGPFSEFGAELGFIHSDRRLRLVQLFDKNSNLSSFTLIRERLINTESKERPHLTVEMLLGKWMGEAVTIYPDWRQPSFYSSTLLLELQGNRLCQHLTAPNYQLSSTASINGSILLFDQGSYPVQVLLLPDGASSTTPLSIPRNCPFFIEAGWLIDDNLRQRMIRSYDEKGGWTSLTLVTERKVS